MRQKNCFSRKKRRMFLRQELTIIPVYSSEISQDIYWQDNNESAQAGRLSADEYAAWFYQYGKVEVTYQDSADKTQKTQYHEGE